MECRAKAMKYGAALSLYSMNAGRKRTKNRTMEWVGPRCGRMGMNRSTSDMTEATKSKGTFTFTLRSLDAAFPDKYPRARCPTAYVDYPSFVLFSVLLQFDLMLASWLEDLEICYGRG